MVRCIDAHREAYGVKPICAVLPIAPSTYYEAKARERDPSRVPVRTQRDAVLQPEIQRVFDATRQRYDRRVRAAHRGLARVHVAPERPGTRYA